MLLIFTLARVLRFVCLLILEFCVIRLVNSRQGVRIMNPGVISKSIYCWASKQTPTSCFFGRYGDFDLSQKPAIFSGDIRSHLSKCMY